MNEVPSLFQFVHVIAVYDVFEDCEVVFYKDSLLCLHLLDDLEVMNKLFLMLFYLLYVIVMRLFCRFEAVVKIESTHNCCCYRCKCREEKQNLITDVFQCPPPSVTSKQCLLQHKNPRAYARESSYKRVGFIALNAY